MAAIVIDEQKMVAWGTEAQEMYGRVPESMEVARPLLDSQTGTTETQGG